MSHSAHLCCMGLTLLVAAPLANAGGPTLTVTDNLQVWLKADAGVSVNVHLRDWEQR